MPSATKATYSLDPLTLERLARLARHWQVSKTEVIRRALAKADAKNVPTAAERIAALQALQKSLKDRRVDFAKWRRTIREGRR